MIFPTSNIYADNLHVNQASTHLLLHVQLNLTFSWSLCRVMDPFYCFHCLRLFLWRVVGNCCRKSFYLLDLWLVLSKTQRCAGGDSHTYTIATTKLAPNCNGVLFGSVSSLDKSWLGPYRFPVDSRQQPARYLVGGCLAFWLVD